MSNVTLPEVRAKILSAIKDEGLSITQASQTHNVSEDSIRRWLRGTTESSQTSMGELQRVKKENETLKQIIGNILLERELAKKNLTRS